MAGTVAQVLHRFGAQYLATHALNTPQAKAWRGILACRTTALGGQQLSCDTCGHSHWQYHSCRNRHCPQCGARAKDAWLQGRLNEVLPVPYAHLVFTLPHSLNGLYSAPPRWLIDTLFARTAQTLSEFAANPTWMRDANAAPAFSLVLHTWTQDLRLHIHVHAVMACGVLATSGKWSTPTRKPDYLFPVQGLSNVFRGKFMAALTRAHHKGDIPHDPQGDSKAWCERLRQLYKHDWVVYAKTPLGGPVQVLEYLSRYTHRTAISNERIRTVTGHEVAFTVRANDKGGKRLQQLPGVEFVRRFLLHVLPSGIKRVRHYGVLASACKEFKLNASKAGVADAAAQYTSDGVSTGVHARVAQIDVSVCPCCGLGKLQVTAVLRGQARLATPTCAMAPCSRGPP